jgi:starvation-inducible DNA-binding protein
MNVMEKSKPAKDTVVHPAAFELKVGADKSGDLLSALNQSLAHVIDLRSRVKQAHWSARGSSFYTLHKMFADFSTELDAIADEISGRVLALGGTPDWTPATIAKISKLPPFPAYKEGATEYLGALVGSYQGVSKQLPAVMTIAARGGDHATASVITACAKLIDEQSSFVAAHLPGA